MALCSKQSVAATCNDIDGTTETITADCQNLTIYGDGSNVTIEAGVTVDSTGNNAANTDNDATNTIITNNGIISSPNNRTFRTNAGEVDELINNGTISAGGNSAIRTNSSITTLTNTGTISAGTNKTIHNRKSGTIGTLTNTGTISAGTGDAINNQGTIGTFSNSGTISSGTFDITNTGTITTLNNLQGAASSALTYNGTLPANYNIIVNSASDFGKITFSNVSGTTNFGIYSTSTLTEGTYSSVISGLSSSNISSGTSGTYSNSNACSDVDAATVTFSSNCAELDISGDGSDITINSGVTISGVGDYDWVLNNSSGTTWDLVSTAQLDDVVNTGTNTSLNNLGTITAVASGANGILNQGTFTTLINRGLVTSDSAYGINNAGTITTFNNLQGASSSALTYTGKLPTDYNVIVNSTSDFGKITFSSVSGTTNFGVHSTSTLEEDTTYSSVISGLSSSEIASGTSGSHISGSSRKEWTLLNSSGSIWDLVIASNQNIAPDTNTSVTTTVKPNVVLGMNNLTSVTEVNFANMNTYDCDLFDKNKICLSLGDRYTSINTPKTEANSAVMVAGYKLSDTLRVAGFYHSNLSHKTPANFQLSDKTPLTGGLIVWNQNPNH